MIEKRKLKSSPDSSSKKQKTSVSKEDFRIEIQKLVNEAENLVTEDQSLAILNYEKALNDFSFYFQTNPSVLYTSQDLRLFARINFALFTLFRKSEEVENILLAKKFLELSFSYLEQLEKNEFISKEEFQNKLISFTKLKNEIDNQIKHIVAIKEQKGEIIDAIIVVTDDDVTDEENPEIVEDKTVSTLNHHNYIEWCNKVIQQIRQIETDLGMSPQSLPVLIGLNNKLPANYRHLTEILLNLKEHKVKVVSSALKKISKTWQKIQNIARKINPENPPIPEQSPLRQLTSLPKLDQELRQLKNVLKDLEEKLTLSTAESSTHIVHSI